MNKSWLDRFKDWMCKCFGHRVERDEYGIERALTVKIEMIPGIEA